MVEDKIGEIKLNIISLFIISIIILGFFVVGSVIADHTVGTTAVGGVIFYALEDVTQVFNITINSTDAVGSNITEVNITLAGGLIFDATSNGSSNATVFVPTNISNPTTVFTNTSNVLSWRNSTGIFAGGNKSLFWFNVTAATPGNYTFNVTTLNDTGSFSTTFTVFVNDTTAPVVNVTGLLNYANVSGTTFNFTLNVTDNVLIDTCLYSLDTGVTNYTMSNITNTIYNATNTSLSDERMYNVTFYCNDSSNNLNSSQTRFFRMDTTKPGVTIESPAGLNYTLSALDFNVTMSENSSFCMYTINDWVTNVTMPAKNLTYFNFTNSTMAATNSATARFWCNDTAGNINDTESMGFRLDATAPAIVILNPALNDSNFSSSSQTFNINVTDNIMISNCSYTLSGGVVNTTLANTTAYTLGNTTAVRFYAANNSIPEGTYEVRFNCRDTTNNLNYSEGRTFNIDSTSPKITITEPGNSSYDRNLRFNITGDTNMSFCKMTIDNWATNLTMTKKVSAGTNTSFNLTYYNIPSASHTVRFWCNDSANNINDTASVDFVVSYFHFNGTIYDVSGVAVNNTNITITIQNMSWGQVWYNSTASNLSGWFNFTLPGNVSWMYQVSIKHINYTHGGVDKVGRIMPLFPYSEFSGLSSPKFYLKEAGTIKISVINRSAHYTNFSYQVKDVKLGFPISGCIGDSKETVCYVPRDRNYSIMVYPKLGGETNFVPVTYEWTNFSSTASHTITNNDGGNISSYNATTAVLNKVFNITESFARVVGFTKHSNGTNFTGWDEFTVVPFLMEGGNRVMKTYGILPYNASAFNSAGTDEYNASIGYYNITLPYAPAETVKYILFAGVKNYTASDTKSYGGYRNITVSGSVTNFNFTMYGLMGSNQTLNMSVAASSSKRGVNTTMHLFTLVNATNDSLSQLSAFVEVTVDYSNYGAMEFVFMEEISQSGSASFYLPLLNVTGIKEMNIYSNNYAPKRVSTKTAAEIIATSNISLKTFNPQALDGTTGAGITIDLYMSNSTCDVPNPPTTCKLTDSSNMDSFNPLSAIIGGGAISFRMGMGNVLVHYVNVDMIASGPPDALFENNTDVTETGTASSGFDKAMRFGSEGPTIYDYVLVSLPYTPGSTTTTGLDEDSQVNISIPILYDENWNIIWNATVNGTNAGALAANLSHYNTYQSEWSTLMGADNNCTTNASIINQTNVCYIDTALNRIWIRLPHFSGTGTSIDGTAIVATATATTVSSGGGGGTAAYWTKTFFVGDEDLEAGYSVGLAKKERFRVTLVNPSSGIRENHYVGVVSVTSNTVTINVSSTPQQATLRIGDERKFDVTEDGYYDLRVKLNSITDDIANLTIKSIREKVTVASEEEEEVKDVKAEEKKVSDEEERTAKIWLWAMVIIVIVVLVGVGYWLFGRDSGEVKKVKK